MSNRSSLLAMNFWGIKGGSTASERAVDTFKPNLTPEEAGKITTFLEGGDQVFDELLFFDGNLDNWDAVVSSPDYYPGSREEGLIKRGAQVSANLIQPPQDMTHVIIGPGTRVDKDLIVTDAALAAEHDVKRIVICDISSKALNLAEEKIREHFAKAVGEAKVPEIVKVHADAFDEHVHFPIVGTALVTSFGFTLDNGASIDEIDKGEMSYGVSRKYKALSNKLPDGSHLITTHDHYSSKHPEAARKRALINGAYDNDYVEEFIMHAAGHYLGISDPRKYLSLKIEINEKTGLVSRFLEVTKPFITQPDSKEISLEKGRVLRCGTSGKMSEGETQACHTLAGLHKGDFPIVRDEVAVMAYHHTLVVK